MSFVPRNHISRQEIWGISQKELQIALDDVQKWMERLARWDNSAVSDVVDGKDVSVLCGKEGVLKLRYCGIDRLFDALSRVAAYNAALDDHEN